MLLPEAQRRGQIHFVMARSLPYDIRLGMIAALLFAGFVIQLYVSLALGAVLLLAGSMLGVVHGYSNIPRDLGKHREWRGADRKQLENVLAIARKSRKWDQSLLDITSGLGALGLLAVAGTTAWIAYLLMEAGYQWLALACVVDVAVLLLPHWVTGVRRVLTNDPLVVKIQELLRVMDLWEAMPHEGETMLPQMQVLTGKGGQMPVDAKLVLRIEPLGEAFLGLQTQVVLNNVQGHDYPYLYCVLVARPELDIGKASYRGCPPNGILAVSEHENQDNVDILVVRQETTRTKGYETKPAAAAAIFTYALGVARTVAAAKAAAAGSVREGDRQ